MFLYLVCNHVPFHSMCSVPFHVFRVEINKEDDLSPDSDSDMMDVDTVSHDSEDKLSAAKHVGGSGPKGGGVSGFIAPDPLPQFTVSLSTS